MKTNAEFVERIKATLSVFAGGALCIWGQWFGRPYDNLHRITDASCESDRITLTFDQGETLSFWNPAGLLITGKSFTAQDASRVRWEWYFYGRPKTPENLCFQDYSKRGDRIIATTNANWHNANLQPDIEKPAVLLA